MEDRKNPAPFMHVEDYRTVGKSVSKLLKELPVNISSFADHLETLPNEEIFSGHRPNPFFLITSKHAYYEGMKRGYIDGYRAAGTYIRRMTKTWLGIET